ncbi:MAG TPA: DEAD/DEAH box helicase, partial [Beutenbergiaceae bacterium]|nr:DEAD/DEAH box helicase [Beutenbergiaceae bacterium]
DPIDPDLDPEGAKTQAEQPFVFYPTVKGVRNHAIVEAVKTLLGPMHQGDLPEPLPDAVREKYGLLTAFEAFSSIHLPPSIEAAERGWNTLRFHEAFVLQAVLARRRRWADQFQATAYPRRQGGWLDQLDTLLPFDLTPGQVEVAEEISADVQRSRPMQRLLQGDVGSGKTVVALRAMLQVIDAGGQTALLAPTEVLAEQHARSIRDLLGPIANDVGLTLLTGSLPTAKRKQALLDAATGDAGIVIGTHALLSESVSFFDLGLVVIDEQHRFGVDQRQQLRDKGKTTPHYLVMTATPIPRSVAMTVFGDVDTSTLKDLPEGRPGVQTHLVPADKPAWMDRVWQRVQEEVAAGGRAFIVCPRITEVGEDDYDDGGEQPLLRLIVEDNRLPLTSVEGLHKRLLDEPALQGTTIGIMHGQLPAAEKERVMEEFISGQTPVLVSTTVIEVGVDIPQAT